VAENHTKPDSRKIQVTLPDGARALFNQLVARKLFGDGNSDVARYLIMKGLDALVDGGRLIDRPTFASSPSTAETPDDEEPHQQP
jgi:hypothetical protein